MPRISKVFSAACNKLWESLKEKLPGDSELESNTLNCIASSGPLTLLPSKDDDGWSLPWSASCHLQGWSTSTLQGTSRAASSSSLVLKPHIIHL